VELHFVPPDLRRLDESGAELLACTMWRDERPMRGLAGLLDWRLAGKLSALTKSGYLTGELGEVLMVPGKPALPYEKVLVFGLGARSGFGDGVFRQVVKNVLRSLEGLRIRRAVVELPGRADGTMDEGRATEILLDCAGDSAAHDAWWLVEEADAQRRIEQRAQDERRRARRGA
jgi:hypothetical protein